MALLVVVGLVAVIGLGGLGAALAIGIASQYFFD